MSTYKKTGVYLSSKYFEILKRWIRNTFKELTVCNILFENSYAGMPNENKIVWKQK